MKELMAIATQHSIPLQGGHLSPPLPKHPVIVVEGLDAAGTHLLLVHVKARDTFIVIVET